MNQVSDGWQYWQWQTVRWKGSGMVGERLESMEVVQSDVDSEYVGSEARMHFQKLGICVCC